MRRIPPIIIISESTKERIDEDTYVLLFICFSTFLNCQKDRIARHTPNATITTPMIPEYPFGGNTIFPANTIEISFRNNANFTITKPKPIKAILVRIQARKVRSLARCSRDLVLLFSSLLIFKVFTILSPTCECV